MASIVFQTPQGIRLIGGLEWRLLPATGSMESQLREKASERGASYAALAYSPNSEPVEVKGKIRDMKRVSAGFYSAPDGSKPPKHSHSLAVAFAHWASAHSEALLSVRTSDGMYAVVAVINGHPVLDRIEPSEGEAYEKALGYLQEYPEISVFADDNVKYPMSLKTQDLLESIGQTANTKATALKSVPVDAVKLALIAVVVGAAVGGYIYHGKWKAEKERKAAIARRAEADPLPRYLKGLEQARQVVGVTRPDLRVAFEVASQVQTLPPGWKVRRMGCQELSGCEAELQRTTGTFEDLRAALPGFELVAATTTNLGVATVKWNQKLGPDRLDPATALPTFADFIQGIEASKLQTWMVAGVSVQVGMPQVWPQVPGVPQSFKSPKALAAGTFEVAGVAMPQLNEVLESAPPNVNWTGWRVEVGEASADPLTRAKVRFTGNYSVKSR